MRKNDTKHIFVDTHAFGNLICIKNSNGKEIIFPLDSVNLNRMSPKVDFIQERDIQLGDWRQIDKKLAYNLKRM